MTTKRKRYSTEFKLEVVKLVIEQKYTPTQASEAMGIAQSTVGKWVTQYRKEKLGITPETGKALQNSEKYRN